MYLKSLTLKGFKSFASATTLRFEPGITCVVGPNGSGKSNVVDAIAWVLGEQGAKSLRGGKMEDVIFAGTTGRPALGRAEVTLTIDNSDGAIPIDYSEVSITRRMYRSGEGEYEINGDRCRLLDVQDLLSDAGIGREMHVLVGQGKLDSYLHARPEDRRAFIEEAAGVLKHRKRKEKALRKLEGMQGNLDRLADLTGELRRQLKPLGRQAELARRAQTIQMDLREARLRLLADDLTSLRGNIAKDLADEEALKERKDVLAEEHERLNAQVGEVEAAHAADKPRLARLQETWYRLQAVAERLRSTAQLAAERRRYLSEDTGDDRAGRDPEVLETEAERIREQEIELRESIAEDSERLSSAVEAREETEAALSEAEQRIVTAVKAAAERREALATLRGRVDSLQTRTAAAAEELERASIALAEARERAEAAAEAHAEAEAENEAVESNTEFDEAVAEAKARVAAAKAEADRLQAAEREADREASQWAAREEALAVGLRRKDGAAALLARADAVPGVLGSVAALLTVEPGYEAVLAAALGRLADAIAVTNPASAAEALKFLRDEDGGQAGFLIAGAQSHADIPAGYRAVADTVKAPAELDSTVRAVLAGMCVADDLDAARAIVDAHPQLTAVTRAGDVLGAATAFGGSAKAQSYIEIQAAVDEARDRKLASESLAAQLREQFEAAREAHAEAEAAAEAVRTAQRQAEAAHSVVARRLAELGAAARSAEAEVARLQQTKDRAQAARESDTAGLTDLEARLEELESLPAIEEPSTDERDVLSRALDAARQNEMETRLSVRTAEERASALAGRADALARQAQSERAARARAEARRASRARGAKVAALVAEAAENAGVALTDSLEAAAIERDQVAAAQTRREAALADLRNRAGATAAELERITSAAHRDEVARAEQRLRIEQLEEKAGAEFGVDIETLLAEYGPDQLVPPSSEEVGAALEKGRPEPEPYEFDRPTMEKRAARGERELKLLGKVNPLALEEFAALEERYKFLNEQLEDVKKTRADLTTVVKEVDDRIQQVFAEAFADTAREFENVFQTVFPGGEGRILLTDPDDMLHTGVEVEARPPGKKVKRLSLLSGGERSLTALALLVAIFRARPSPFYLMDEVEAALDDVNLGRLLDLLRRLQENSQLLIITHQKRTMEIGDALYGVTMRAGVTQVISQKFSREED
ncbi:chromosome segregation protein SMC [Glycomyces algeriensis]|uniref:Chromosome partition protein Smc n=1 Tax=Glycomyces algeriensis TaxID=256037 RepID=A0A9W6GDQ8_9ACTN|nr:chromosome segregation protein SMC [Glycomyces algeriensis]MDA1366476.1 chromosome segregation protein SMC [Glycomyces algeriensis]MDR7352135.1 chromosome segregation protein [Glycomyces algeriensis]GLI44868.1 chromosome partition protein Smc [Glycomyces algeriensis]